MKPSRPRDRILDTATRLFYQDGIQAVGVSQIIDQAEVAPMTLYRQFHGKDELVAATLEQWSAQWLDRLGDRLGGRDGERRAALAALWDSLEDWFASEDFRGSFVANAAAELRSRPDHPAHKVIAAHRTAMRRLLEGIAELQGARDPAAVAAQLEILVDGAVAVAVVDRRPAAAASARALAETALAADRNGRPLPAGASGR
jgi:AcrR family transcriptional regulator